MKSISDLRSCFYDEHARDRRLTLINYLLILCFIALLGGLLNFLGVDLKQFLLNLIQQGENDGSPAGIYHTLLPLAIAAFILGYPVFLLWKISKRPKKIEELLLRVSQGAKPTTVHDSVEYKLTVPLLKINLKLCPVTFATIYLDNSVSPYVLPIRSAYVPDMKIILSGANVEEINEIRKDLYTHTDAGSQEAGGKEGASAPTPVKTVEEFRTFIDKELKEDLAALETSRKSIHKSTQIGKIAAGVIVVGMIGYFFYKNQFGGGMESYSSPFSIILPITIVSLIVAFSSHFIAKRKGAKNTVEQSLTFGSHSFKEKIITRIVHFINPSLTYVPIAHLGLKDINESGLFVQKPYTLDGSDQISGRHNGVPFLSGNLSMYYKENLSEEGEASKCAFSGQFFIARFNKSFSTPVYVIPRKNKYDTTSYLTSDKGEDVKLEDPEFMKMFKVYAADQLTARYILTPSLMERIKELAKREKGVYHIAFYNNNITVANNSGENNFDIDSSRSMTDNNNQLLIEYYTDLCNQLAIIDELKLNINIWKK